MYGSFLEETRALVNEAWDISTAASFIEQHTYLRGARYSFVDHEFQRTIISDACRVVNVQKCSQIGLSEIMARYGVALVNMIPDFSVIVTFPFSGDAADFAKTRIDPFIESSPRLKLAVNSKLNSGEKKQFGTSFMYFRGTNGKTQAISIPADMIISDEIDRSDPHVLTQYTSRLTHSKFRLRRNFSTPTIPKYGIAAEMLESMRYRNICKCCHCGHGFVPDYFEHVKIPGYDNDLRTITKNNIGKTRYLDAVLLCPACFKPVNLGPEHREWVVENNMDSFEAHGYYVSPFDAPNIISIPDLIKASTQYARYSEFVNQNLGIEEEDEGESLTLTDLNRAMLPEGTDMRSSQLHCMGIDVGATSNITIGRITLEGQFIVCYRERVPLAQMEERKRKLAAEWKVVVTVMDSQPYTDLVMRFQKSDKNLYGAVFSNSKKLEMFKVQMFDGDEDEGKMPIHTVQIDRDKAFDALLGVIKGGAKDGSRQEFHWVPVSQDDDELFEKQLLDMRRVQVFDQHQELKWTWVKSKVQNDHYHFSLLYLYVACLLRGTANREIPLGTGVTLIRGFKVKRPELIRP